MTIPNINTYSVDDEAISLYWKASPKSDIKKWNVYGSSSAPININDPVKGVDISGFTLIREGIPNRDSELTPGSVYTTFKRSELSIGMEDGYYFIITSINTAGEESVPNVIDLHAVPFSDTYFVDEAGQPSNVVYKNFEFSISPTSVWDVDRFLDMISLLGRPAKQMRIVTKNKNIQIKINAFNSDAITIDVNDEYPFTLSRGEMLFKRIWFHNPDSTPTTVRLFVAG